MSEVEITRVDCIINLSSAELAKRVVKVKGTSCFYFRRKTDCEEDTKELLPVAEKTSKILSAADKVKNGLHSVKVPYASADTWTQ